MVFVLINALLNLGDRMRSLGVRERRAQHGLLGVPTSRGWREKKKKRKSQKKKMSEKWLVRDKDNRIAGKKPGWEWGKVRSKGREKTGS